MSFFSILRAAIFGTALTLGAQAPAAVLDFDLSNVCTSTDCITGGFSFDTDTQSFVSESAVFQGMNYNNVINASLVNDGTNGSPAKFVLFEDDSPSLYELHISVVGFDTVMPGLAVNQTQNYSIEGGHYMDAFMMSPFVDSSVSVTRRAPSLDANVPLPAGLPLILTGLAAFGIARKRKATK